MSIHLRPDQEAYLQEIAARTGRDPSEIAQEWVDRLFEHEDRRAALIAQLDEAEESLARGEGIELTSERMRALGDDVKRRGRERLADRGGATRR